MADDRGTLTIRRRVYERLAQHAALSVDDVVAQSTGLTAAFDDQTATSAALFRSLPHAMAREDGAAITLTVALRWPTRVNDVCAMVRDVVSDDVLRFTGSRPERVDVDVAQLVSGSAKESASTSTRPRPVRRRAGFIDLPPVGDSVDEVEAIGS
ncbi:Asp23/Gls24 family envelope stress response protein [Gordonia sp. TBRC 11910]|uniref:Asp23/Gls24 family envelope stress response protein n=1 Tax=Gordonia asplenii TaxID=2725283 RepID=A0A848KU86_9ACTN|nr:Asp23/Gls24 family envelope stress response protein [Gordonia asplenii]NMO02080.1 Asp23/Gls24 family envelope stress response protein [Gordonia asplenii]